MAKPDDTIRIYEVLPHNFDAILEESAKSRHPFTREQLVMIHAEARAQNTVAVVAMLDDVLQAGLEDLRP